MIEVENFTKTFDGVRAVSGLSFAVESGEVFAFLGANGSGKTTTTRALLGIYPPDEGTLHINGQPYDLSQAGSIGYLPEERGLYTSSRVLEVLVYFGQLKGLNKPEAIRRARDYLERVDLEDKQDVEIKRLSSGQQQKIQLGTAIINRPGLLILDEPTKGLDPVNRSLLMDSLLQLNADGTTVVFITHQMDEVERIADRVLIIKDGKRRAYGEINQVKQEYGEKTIHIRYSGHLPGETELYTASVKRRQAEITPRKGVEADDILRFLLRNEIKITEFNLGAPSLEQVFIKVYDED